jgi:hypothetical protein
VSAPVLRFGLTAACEEFLPAIPGRLRCERMLAANVVRSWIDDPRIHRIDVNNWLYPRK